MNKKITLSFCILVLIIFSSCVDFNPLKIEGTWESTNPKIRIDISANPHHGEFTKDDETVIKIAFYAARGRFFIWEADEEKKYGTDAICLFKGKYKHRGETLILFVDDGSRIVSKKVEDVALKRWFLWLFIHEYCNSWVYLI